MIVLLMLVPSHILSKHGKFLKQDLTTEIGVVNYQEDGGWWEGTLDGKTGWFPSNYVKELEPGGASSSAATPSVVTAAAANADEIAAKRLEFRQQLVRDVLEKEREFVVEMRTTLVKKYLAPLRLRPDM